MDNYKDDWYKFSDGWFTYYVNRNTGEKRYNLDDDEVVMQMYTYDTSGNLIDEQQLYGRDLV